MPLREEDVLYNENVRWNATPRKHASDDITRAYQNKIANSQAAIKALRAYPGNARLLQDVDAPVEFTDYIGEGVRGQYTEDESGKKVSVDIGRTPQAMQNTLYHEFLHNLQHQNRNGFPPGRYAATNSPLGVLDTPQRIAWSNEKVPGEGTPKEFYDALSANELNYGPGEAAAFMASNLNQGTPMAEEVRRVAALYPGMAGVFAGKVSQPNRPEPIHSKGYPEMGSWERVRTALGFPPEVPIDERLNAARVQILRKLNEQTKPRERN